MKANFRRRVGEYRVHTRCARAARQALVAGINHFATLTNCRIIAEGIETEVECQAVRRLGIDFGQGFLFGRPEPVDAYRDLLTVAEEPAARVPPA